jgi:NAD(P)-dependent dehydrogenase (short-subunit alcohol dehydrogenase family)
VRGTAFTDAPGTLWAATLTLDHKTERSRITIRVSGDAGRDFTLGMQALKRVARPDDIGDALAFLASDEARGISGDTLRVDGGSKL